MPEHAVEVALEDERVQPRNLAILRLAGAMNCGSFFGRLPSDTSRAIVWTWVFGKRRTKF
jgi:hypothetical protein